MKKPTKNSYTEIYRCVGIVQILQQLISEALSQDKYEMNRCFLSVYGWQVSYIFYYTVKSIWCVPFSCLCVCVCVSTKCEWSLFALTMMQKDGLAQWQINGIVNYLFNPPLSLHGQLVSVFRFEWHKEKRVCESHLQKIYKMNLFQIFFIFFEML